MKRLLFLSIFLLAGVLPAKVFAWTIDSFTSDITVQPNADINITETVLVNFDIKKHGILRDIPFGYTGADGKDYTIPIDQVTVHDENGGNIQVEQSTNGNFIELRIGNPSKTITGKHTYVISYRAQAAVNFFTDHDELYWNITGDQWEVPIVNSTATIHLPGTIAPDSIQVQCFSGPYGSTEHKCTSSTEASTAKFHAQDFLTVVVGWSKGIVTQPANYSQIRSNDIATPPKKVERWQVVTNWVVNIGAPIFALLWLIVTWIRHGRDPKGKRTVVAQYDPPDNLRPAAMDVIVHEQVRKEAFSATIIDLAVRGYVHIDEVKTEKLFGLRKEKDYKFTLKKLFVNDTTLLDYEKTILAGIFAETETPMEQIMGLKAMIFGKFKGFAKDDATTAMPVGTEVLASEIGAAFSMARTKAMKALYQYVADEGYFVKNPNKARSLYTTLGIVLFVVVLQLGFGLIANLFLLGLVTIPGAMLIISHVIPKRTTKGVEALWHAKGFKEYLHTAERYRIQWQEKEHIFEQFLPYAMVFGVAKEWSNALKDVVREQPDWYTGSYSGNFTALVLWSALDDFTTTSMKSFISPASSGSSGFGGGGFSGGGGGGGGGGSW